MTDVTEYWTIAFSTVQAQVVEWDPADHGGQREPWEAMEATMDQGWPAFLAERGVQSTMDAALQLRYTNPETGQRRVLRRASVLPLEVPAHLAARASADALSGVLAYEPPSGTPR